MFFSVNDLFDLNLIKGSDLITLYDLEDLQHVDQGKWLFLVNIGQKILVILEFFCFFQTFPNKWKIFLRDFQDEENLSVNRLTITYIFPNSNCIFNTEIEKPMC